MLVNNLLQRTGFWKKKGSWIILIYLELTEDIGLKIYNMCFKSYVYFLTPNVFSVCVEYRLIVTWKQIKRIISNALWIKIRGIKNNLFI